VSARPGRLHRAAVLAERAAVAVQYAELTGPRADVALIAGLQQVADALYQHPRHLDPPVAPRRNRVENVISYSSWLVVTTAVLLIAPHPARPWTVAAAMTAGLTAMMLLARLVSTTWDRYPVRVLTAGRERDGVTDLIAALRTELSQIAATLEPVRHGADLEVGRRLEYALGWLDIADDAATGTAHGD
jgi:hypothetical protein